MTNAHQVAPGVHRVDSHGIVNWYLVEDGGRVAAIDAGLPPDWETLERVMRALGKTTSDLEAVVLTHAHIDHTGFAERARTEGGAKVYVPNGEKELAAHQLRAAKSERNPLLYMRYGPTRKLMLTVARTGAFQSRPIREFEGFDPGDVLEAVPGKPRAIDTAGHTFGHVALHMPDRDVLFTGDALVTYCPYSGRIGPRLVARAATADVERGMRSFDAIAETGAGTLLPGHGEPWTGGAEDAARHAREAGVA